MPMPNPLKTLLALSFYGRPIYAKLEGRMLRRIMEILRQIKVRMSLHLAAMTSLYSNVFFVLFA